MKIISISNEQYTLVDDSDYAWLSKFKWTAQKRKHGFHAARYFGKKYIYMHRLIADAPKGIEVDHLDGDGLNNQRVNLRSAAKAQNGQGFRPLKGKASRYRGVSWHKGAGRFVAQLDDGRKRVYLGLHDSEENAARAYDTEARLRFGEFAQLNFP